MITLKASIELILSAALFINALLFVPQIIRLIKEKSAKGVSLITFVGFLLIQLAIVLHGFIVHNYVLIAGYIFSMLTTSTVVILILIYRKKKSSMDELTLEEIIAQMPGNVYWLNKNRVYLGCNDNQAKVAGLNSRKEIIGKRNVDIPSFIIPEVIDPINEKVISTGKTMIVEEPAMLPNGTKGIFLSSKVPLKNKLNEVVGMVGISIDISQAKQAIQDRLDFLENIIAEMPGNVYWMDRNGVYLGCNDNQAKVIGLKSRQEIVGKRNIDFQLLLMPEVFDPINEKVMSTGEAIITEETVTLLDGTEIPVLSNKVPIKNNRGEVTGMVGISIDITERKEAEKQILIAKDRAEAANKAKENFLANMRHDMRTPFTGILTLAQLMENEEYDPEKKENLHHIATSANVLLEYLNEILSHAKIESGTQVTTLQEVDLEKIIQDALATINPVAITKKLQLNFDYPLPIPKMLVTDKFKLQRILINLLGNAAKFTSKGSITVEVEIASETATDITLNIAVKDTGIGIPADKREEIFGKFAKLNNAYTGRYQGMGLGLYDVKELCHQLGGKISVTDNHPQGSIFTCTIPFKKTAQSSKKIVANEKTEKPPITADLSKFKVLLVEDHPIAAMATSHLLRLYGYQVDIADTGFGALEKFSHNKYDIILMDIGLPDIDGVQVTKKIRDQEKINHQPKTPILAVTAHKKDENEGMEIFDDVYTKPFVTNIAEEIYYKYLQS